jgi:4-hydroxythreonine-4-phosphate dehydrogenase
MSLLWKPTLGITLGDPHGIGPELVFKLFRDKRLLEHFTPIVYGPGAALHHYQQLHEKLRQLRFTQLELDESPDSEEEVALLYHKNTSPELASITPGQPSPTAGEAARKALELALQDAKAGIIDGIVTLPIDKATIQSEAFSFPGHTEYLAQAYGVRNPLMLMAHEGLRVAVVTSHIALQDVPKAITIDRIQGRIRSLIQTLREDFSINKPKIAVLALNPHAGDGGLLGKEEQEIIIPALQKLQTQLAVVMGPYPADGFFALDGWRKYDAILAMYHDQGLIPFKSISHGAGVNFTAGLPLVRTSPDHGTAYDIAGKWQCDPASSRNAIYTAIDILRRRTENQVLTANALKAQPRQSERGR